jgi:hypothetical protein
MDIPGQSRCILHASVETLDFLPENTDFPGPDHRLVRASSWPAWLVDGECEVGEQKTALCLASATSHNTGPAGDFELACYSRVALEPARSCGRRGARSMATDGTCLRTIPLSTAAETLLDSIKLVQTPDTLIFARRRRGGSGRSQ